jgi:hypothetical protein
VFNLGASRGRGTRVQPDDREDKAITPERYRLDGLAAAFSTSESLSQRAELDAEIGIIHGYAWPNQPHQFARWDDCACAFNQLDQDRECPAAEVDLVVRQKQLSFSRHQPERAKCIDRIK